MQYKPTLKRTKKSQNLSKASGKSNFSVYFLCCLHWANAVFVLLCIFQECVIKPSPRGAQKFWIREQNPWWELLILRIIWLDKWFTPIRWFKVSDFYLIWFSTHTNHLCSQALRTIRQNNKLINGEGIYLTRTNSRNWLYISWRICSTT